MAPEDSLPPADQIPFQGGDKPAASSQTVSVAPEELKLLQEHRDKRATSPRTSIPVKK